MHEVIRDLIGRPYALPSNPPNTFDCWSLVTHVRDIVALPIPILCSDKNTIDEEYEAQIRKGLWKPLISPKNYCIALMGHRHDHSGIYLEGLGILHAVTFGKEVGSVRIDSEELLKRWCYRIEYWEALNVS